VADEVTDVTLVQLPDNTHDGNDSHQRKKRKIEVSRINWSPNLRLSILHHMITMEIFVSMLMDVIETYRFDLEEEADLVEIIRALDILGADMRLSEYEAVLYIKLRNSEKNKCEWTCGERLPVNFFNHIQKFEFAALMEEAGSIEFVSAVLGTVGSQRLIEYYNNYNQCDKNTMFFHLCINDHLIVAQWLYGLGGVNIHAGNDLAFRFACSNGHLSVAQWLYDLGGVNIHTMDDYAFRFTCSSGLLSVAQWLYGLGGINIHAENDYAFRKACKYGYLPVARWLYTLDGYSAQVLRESKDAAASEVSSWLQSIIARNLDV
jgi:hypothetical protein